MKKTTQQAAPVKLADQVIARIQKDISSGKYKEGSRIPTEPELMAQYNVGRSTIREAIKTLANAGILKVQQGSGTTVMPQSGITGSLSQRLRNAGKETAEVAAILEKEIVQLAVQNRNNKDLKALKTILTERMEAIAQENNEAVADADARFLAAMAASGRNSLLADLYTTFVYTQKESSAKRDAGKKAAQHHASHKIYEKLLAAITAQNGKDAVKLADQRRQAD
ncbi:FadR/GntR family transcriptional regulator [Chitinophagaceae bacterium MMS25-I14]